MLTSAVCIQKHIERVRIVITRVLNCRYQPEPFSGGVKLDGAQVLLNPESARSAFLTPW